MYEAFASVINWIYGLVGNHGWAIVVFTILVRLICTPFDYKSRVGMKKMQAIQPKAAAIQKKYATDQEKMNRKLSELYRQEHINPMSSCLPMLITLPLLWVMFGAMRLVANQHMVEQTFQILQGETPVLESWLWVKNIWMPDSPVAAVWPDLATLRVVTDSNIWVNAFNAAKNLPAELALTVESFSSANLTATIETICGYMQTLPAYAQMTAPLPGFPTLNLWIAQITLLANSNGWFILPVLSAVTQYLMTILQPTAPAPAGGDAAAQQQAATGKFMKYFFPLFSLLICSSYNAVFAIYWVTSNVAAAVQNVIINKVVDKKEMEAAALQQAEGDVK